jgi:hypothetical protein
MEARRSTQKHAEAHGSTQKQKMTTFYGFVDKFYGFLDDFYSFICFAFYAVQILSPQYKTLITFFRGEGV